MEKITESFQTLKNIYLDEAQKDFESGLDFNASEEFDGLGKVQYWKIVADKFGFVMKKKNPELFKVFEVIVKEILQIVEDEVKKVKEEGIKEKKMLGEENERLMKVVNESEGEIRVWKSEVERMKNEESDRKENRVLEEIGQNPDTGLVVLMKGLEKENVELKQCLEGVRKELEAEILKNSQLDLTIQQLKTENQDLIFANNELQIALEDSKAKSFEDSKAKSFEDPKPKLLKSSEVAKIPSKPSESLQNHLKSSELPQKLSLPEDSKSKSSSQKLILNPKIPINPKESAKKTLIKPRSMNSHDLTIRQLKETIEDIYQIKSKFDEKCQESRQTRETMDQFLYTYLNQKYGLKSLIAEWSVLILKAIDKYESTDAEISLFCKIINHRVDEDYRLVFDKLKDNMKQVLKAKIHQRDQYMREIQLNSILKEKISGVLDEDEWATIIVSMFSQEESEYMIGNFKTLLEENSSKLILARKSKNITKKGDASYSEFQNFILNYDLSAREALLSPFFQYFTVEDFDKNGILSSDEFRNLCNKLGLDSEYPRLIMQVDPYNSGFVTFSDCVSLFTYELVALEDQPAISVIHYLFFQSKSRI